MDCTSNISYISLRLRIIWRIWWYATIEQSYNCRTAWKMVNTQRQQSFSINLSDYIPSQVLTENEKEVQYSQIYTFCQQPDQFLFDLFPFSCLFVSWVMRAEALLHRILILDTTHFIPILRKLTAAFKLASNERIVNSNLTSNEPIIRRWGAESESGEVSSCNSSRQRYFAHRFRRQQCKAGEGFPLPYAFVII